MILDTDLTRRALDLAQALTAVGVAALLGMVFNLRDRVKGIETTLTRFSTVDTRGEEHAVQLGQHEVRLDGHDRELGQIRREQAVYPAPQRGTPERSR